MIAFPLMCKGYFTELYIATAGNYQDNIWRSRIAESSALRETKVSFPGTPWERKRFVKHEKGYTCGSDIDRRLLRLDPGGELAGMSHN
jgi:hypothetical protein